MTEARAAEPDPQLLTRLLLQVANGEVSAAEVFGMHPYVLQKLTDRAVALLDRGKTEEGEALLENLTVVDGKSVTLPFLLGATRAQRGEHARDVTQCATCSTLIKKIDSQSKNSSSIFLI